MIRYEHTQIGYLMIFVTVFVSVLFLWAYLTVEAEPSSVDSGANLAVTALMVLILLTLTSFLTLKVSIDEKYLRIKFGYGIFKNKFLLEEIISARCVKNHWYYGWGIRLWFWPKMLIYNVSGFDAVEIKTKTGKIYRIGTDQPRELETEINRFIEELR